MAKTVLSPASVVTKAARAQLAAGPLSEPVLVRRLIADGLVLGDDPEDRLLEVLDSDRFVELDDERLVDVVALASGVVFSHLLGPDEIASGKVALHPDLSVLDDLESAGVAVSAAAGRLDHDHDGDICVLAGPAGWLGAEAAVGDLLCVTVGEGGTSTDVVSGPLPVTAEAVEALRAAFEMLTDDEDEPEPVEVFTVWLEAMVAEPEAFRRAQAPLSQLLAAADLEAHGNLVAPAGFDWGEWDSALELEAVTRRWQLDEVGAIAWVVVSTAYERFADGDLPEADPGVVADSEEIWAGLAAMTSYGTVVQAFVGETLEAEPDLDGSVSLFAERLLEAASGKSLAGPRWLLAICAERDGRTLEAEALVTESLAADGSFLPALEDAAWYAADRGDARRAASLLRRAGADADDEMLAIYDRYARVPTAPVGRNDRCPCGSGRKYKHCHLGKAALPLTERCNFLYKKAGAFLQRGGHGRRLYAIATTLAGDDDLMGMRDAMRDPIVADLALFEDGGWGEFLTARGMLLPTDELFLAQQWQLIDRSIHEIQAVDPGRSLTARDVRTGDVVEVRERSASRQLAVGDLICARIVPDGAGYQIFGGIERVGLHQRDPLIALLDSHPSGVELADWFAAAHAPPCLVNYEHEPTVLCTLSYTVDDPAHAVEVLDKILEATNPGEWIETVETEQMERTIRGMLRLEADLLTVETNSEVRADRLDLLLLSEVPGLHPFDDVRIPAAEGLADRASVGLSSDPATFPEGAAEFMAQMIGDYERRWLDTSIPALAGLTPRQAADDPTRREDLLALLTSFDRFDGDESPGDANSSFMSADRLRALLGLT